jgi:hypothetical protein
MPAAQKVVEVLEKTRPTLFTQVKIGREGRHVRTGQQNPSLKNAFSGKRQATELQLFL